MFFEPSDHVKVWSWICQYCVAANSAAVAPQTQEGDCIRIQCRNCSRTTTVFINDRYLVADRRSHPRD
jgi:hypothetical protein